MKHYFIADMHFGAEPLARRRGFADANTMDRAVVTAWRERVGAGDVVWVVGDVGEPATLADLPGTKHLILGNTDTPLRSYRETGLFASIAKSHELVTADGPWLLVHRPQDVPAGYMGPVVHGHIHAKSWPDARYVCVSVDQTLWGPLGQEDVARRLSMPVAVAAL